jgi:hypothetical protein
MKMRKLIDGSQEAGASGYDEQRCRHLFDTISGFLLNCVRGGEGNRGEFIRCNFNQGTG